MDDRKRPRPNTRRLNAGGEGPLPQENPFLVRLDPSSKPGEFNFVIDGPEEATRRVPAVGLTADASGAIPPELHRAVDEVLGFIYALDTQLESRRKPRK